jgi:hypothetical protein
MGYGMRCSTLLASDAVWISAEQASAAVRISAVQAGDAVWISAGLLVCICASIACCRCDVFMDLNYNYVWMCGP